VAKAQTPAGRCRCHGSLSGRSEHPRAYRVGIDPSRVGHRPARRRDARPLLAGRHERPDRAPGTRVGAPLGPTRARHSSTRMQLRGGTLRSLQLTIRQRASRGEPRHCARGFQGAADCLRRSSSEWIASKVGMSRSLDAWFDHRTISTFSRFVEAPYCRNAIEAPGSGRGQIPHRVRGIETHDRAKVPEVRSVIQAARQRDPRRRSWTPQASSGEYSAGSVGPDAVIPLDADGHPGGHPG
jgi:hypothetical protein